MAQRSDGAPPSPPANGSPPGAAPPVRLDVAEPVIRIVDDLLRQGLAEGASDVHVEPHPDRMRVRTRVDGFLVTSLELPLALHAPVVSRIKITPRVSSSCCRPCGGTPRRAIGRA